MDSGGSVDDRGGVDTVCLSVCLLRMYTLVDTQRVCVGVGVTVQKGSSVDHWPTGHCGLWWVRGWPWWSGHCLSVCLSVCYACVHWLIHRECVWVCNSTRRIVSCALTYWTLRTLVDRWMTAVEWTLLWIVSRSGRLTSTDSLRLTTRPRQTLHRESWLRATSLYCCTGTHRLVDSLIDWES